MGRGGVEVTLRYGLCLVAEGSQVRIYLKPLRGDLAQVAHLLLLSVRKAKGNHLTHLIPGWHDIMYIDIYIAPYKKLTKALNVTTQQI